MNMKCPHATTNTIYSNEHGIALVSALLLGLIGMLMAASLLLMVNAGTWISGSQKRYQMALDAAHGGLNFFTKEIIQRGREGSAPDWATMGNYGMTNGVPLLTPVITYADFKKKLTTTGRFGDGTYPTPASFLTTPSLPPNPPDATVTFTFPTGPNIAVDTTVVSTSRGNSGTSSIMLQGGGVVSNNSGTIIPQHIPYLYQTETRGQSATNPIENAVLSSIYVY